MARYASRLTLLSLLGLMAPAALAGSVTVFWGPSPNATGYRLHYGTSPGQYTTHIDVGNSTQITLNNLQNCTNYHFAATAYNSGGESGYSAAIASWARPSLRAPIPWSVEQGRTLTLSLAGTNFRPGSSMAISTPNVTVNSMTILSCTQILLNLTAGASATPGRSTMTVTHSNGLAGSLSNVFTIAAAAAPAVISTVPADGATGVALSARPMVLFNEAMLPSSVTPSTVRLLDATGSPVNQAAGSPFLVRGGTAATIVPAAGLQQDQRYRIQVFGGASGVRDMINLPLPSTFSHALGFFTIDLTPPVISQLASSGVTGTSAVIGWTTNEPATSEVLYRRQGDIVYQQISGSTKATSHSVALSGLYPNTTYQVHVLSVDGGGNSATSSPDLTVVTTSSPYRYILLEAEAGVLAGPLRQQSSPLAFAGAFIDTPAGIGSGTASYPLGTANYGVNLPASGAWFLWVRMWGGNQQANSFFERIDSAARQPIAVEQESTWKWVAGRSYTLAAGMHTLQLGGRERLARADRILLTNDPSFGPVDQPGGGSNPPAGGSASTATPVGGGIHLSRNHSESTEGAPGGSANFLRGGLTDGPLFRRWRIPLD